LIALKYSSHNEPKQNKRNGQQILTSESLMESFSGVVMEGSTLRSPEPTPPRREAPGLVPRTLWLLLDELLLASGGSEVVFESSSSSSSLAEPSSESPGTSKKREEN